MAEYRIYFLNRKDAIQAREDFVAPSDGDAIVIGSVVADACSEEYDAYEIWSFARRVVAPLAAIPAISLADVSHGRQEQILDLENTMQRSRWAVAKSRRLLEKTNELSAYLRRIAAPPQAIEPISHGT